MAMADEGCEESSLTGPEVCRIDTEAGDQEGDGEHESSQHEAKPSAIETEEGAATTMVVRGEEDGTECDGCEVAPGERVENLGVCATIPDASQLDGDMEPGGEVEEEGEVAQLENNTLAKDEEGPGLMDAEDGNGMGSEGVEVNNNNRTSSGVPAAWHRILQTWNDPAVGAGLEDSALSCGEFERPLHGGDEPAMSSSSGGSSHAGNDVVMDAAVEPLEASAPSRTSSGSATERAESGPKQTNLKGWLK